MVESRFKSASKVSTVSSATSIPNAGTIILCYFKPFKNLEKTPNTNKLTHFCDLLPSELAESH